MTRDEIHKSTKFVDLDDIALCDFLLNRYEHLKSLDEKKKKDEELNQKKLELKELYDERYNIDIKACKAQLKAARAIAKARGIVFKLPKDALDDD